MKGRKEKLQRAVADRNKVNFVTRYKGWKIIESYIKGKIKEAKNAFYQTDIDHLSNKKIIRATIAQRATVKALQGLLNFIYEDGDKVEMEKDIAAIEEIEEEVGEEE